MRRRCILLAIAMVAGIGLAQQAPTAGPCKALKTARVGGDGGFDYVYADVAGRRLHIPRSGAGAQTRSSRWAKSPMPACVAPPSILAGGSDGAVFDPATMGAFSSAGNATLTIVKENSPASFVQEQIV